MSVGVLMTSYLQAPSVGHHSSQQRRARLLLGLGNDVRATREATNSQSNDMWVAEQTHILDFLADAHLCVTALDITLW